MEPKRDPSPAVAPRVMMRGMCSKKQVTNLGIVINTLQYSLGAMLLGVLTNLPSIISP